MTLPRCNPPLSAATMRAATVDISEIALALGRAAKVADVWSNLVAGDRDWIRSCYPTLGAALDELERGSSK
jgi:hypothetical protein